MDKTKEQLEKLREVAEASLTKTDELQKVLAQIEASIWARTFWSSSVFVRDASATSLNFSNCSLVLSMINKLEINHF